MTRTVWINGALCGEDDARLSPFDHGLLTGDGVFETVRVTSGTPFAWSRHYERLGASAGGLGLAVLDGSVLRDAVDAVLGANGITEGRVRITITGGPAPLGSDRGTEGATTLVAASPPNAVAPDIDVVIAPWPRNERGALAGLKTISYGENVKILADARRRGAGEAILANTAGNLCEGTGTNVFLVADGTLTTPPLTAGCLAGVTRGLVLEVAATIGQALTETDVPVAALGGAEEAFLTSTTRRIQPIRRVDGRGLTHCPGPVTAALTAAFLELESRTLDP